MDEHEEVYVLAGNIRAKINGVRVGLDLGTIKARLISFLRKNGVIKRSQLCELCELTEKQANDILKKLVDSGEIVKEGRGPATAYHLRT